MNRDDYIENLFNDIKDDVLIDTDVIALEKLLVTLLDSDFEASVKDWKYLLNKYDIKAYNKDVDFCPLLNSYPLELIKKVGLKKFFALIQSVNFLKRREIYKLLFNVYDFNSGIYLILKDIISKKELDLEQSMIELILENQMEYPIDVFDLKFFLKNVILLHLDLNVIDEAFLLKLTDIPESAKERAVLKTLLIGYVRFT